jgi:acyl-CoA dehydrogenase
LDSRELDDVLRSVRSFVRTTVVPLEEQIERNGAVPAEVQQAAKDMGLFGFAIPERFGGLGLSVSEEVQLVFELGYTTPALRSLFGTNNGLAGHVLIHGGTPEQQAFWLPKFAWGEVAACFALTAPAAGSDPSSLTTSAVRDGDSWVISGAKRYITNAPVADMFMVFARTDSHAPAGRGISNIMVAAGTPGLTIGPNDEKMGQLGALSADVYLDEVRVPASDVVGGEQGVGSGYRTAMACLARGRIHIAALCVGMTERLVAEAVQFARQRRQGGHPIGEYQLVQGLLADSHTEYLAARALVERVAADYDAGRDVQAGPSAAKYFCSEVVGRVADRAVQVHGGAGYMRGVAVERFYRDARLFRLYEGTSQIQQLIIARALLADR